MKRKLKLSKQTAMRFDREDLHLLNSLSEKFKLTKSDIIRIAIRKMATEEQAKSA